MSNEHFYERTVIRDTAFLETVEAAMMQTGLGIYADPEAHPNEKQLALAVFLNEVESARFARFFAWVVLFNPALRQQVFKDGQVTPQDMDGENLRTLIRGAWSVAANVPTGAVE